VEYDIDVLRRPLLKEQIAIKKQFAYFVLSILAITVIFITTANINQAVGHYADTITIISN